MGLPFSPLLNYMQTRTDIPKLLMPVCHISAHKRVLMITIWDPNLGPLQGGSYDNFDLLSCNPPFCITAYPLPFLFPVGGYSPVPGQGCSPARSFCQHSTDTQPCAAARPGIFAFSWACAASGMMLILYTPQFRRLGYFIFVLLSLASCCWHLPPGVRDNSQIPGIPTSNQQLCGTLTCAWWA